MAGQAHREGLLRPSFMPPTPIRRLRDFTRLRVDLTAERGRYWQRLEKLLEDALIKVSSVASKLDTGRRWLIAPPATSAARSPPPPSRMRRR